MVMSEIKIERYYINQIGRLLLNFPEGIGKNEIYQSKIATKITIDKYINRMIQNKLVQVEKAPKRGLRNKYKLTEQGIKLFSKGEVDPSSFINVKIEIQEKFFESLAKNPQYGMKDALALKERYERAMENPYESFEIAKMLSDMMLAYVRSFLDESYWTGNIMQDKRVMIVATLPKDVGKMIEEMKEAGIMKHEVEALNMIFNLGTTAISNLYKDFKTGKLNKLWTMIYFTPFDTTDGIKPTKLDNNIKLAIALKLKEKGEELLSQVEAEKTKTA